MRDRPGILSSDNKDSGAPTMKVGIPKEIKTLEFRVGMTPAGIRELVHDGHEVVV